MWAADRPVDHGHAPGRDDPQFLIHIYSVGYMHGDKGYAGSRLLALFTFFMLVLVMATVSAHVRRLGRGRPLLLPAHRFWYEKKISIRRGIKAFVVNRWRLRLLARMLLIFVTFAPDFAEVFKA